MTYLRGLRLQLRINVYDSSWVPRMHELMGQEKGIEFPLAMLCWSHARAECENELDKAFGLWALAPRCCCEAVPVDYLLTLEQVLERLMAHHIADYEFSLSGELFTR
jgi:hypothetical protein